MPLTASNNMLLLFSETCMECTPIKHFICLIKLKVLTYNHCPHSAQNWRQCPEIRLQYRIKNKAAQYIKLSVQLSYLRRWPINLFFWSSPAFCKRIVTVIKIWALFTFYICQNNLGSPNQFCNDINYII